MSFWTNVIIVFHVIVALGIIGLVLLQHGKGADMGSGFGGGASGSLFGASGSANFLSRMTAVLATIFFLLSLTLAYLATNRPGEGGSSVVERAQRLQQGAPAAKDEKKDVPGAAAPAAPAVPAPQGQSAAPASPAAPGDAKGKDRTVPQ